MQLIVQIDDEVTHDRWWIGCGFPIALVPATVIIHLFYLVVMVVLFFFLIVLVIGQWNAIGLSTKRNVECLASVVSDGHYSQRNKQVVLADIPIQMGKEHSA